MFTRTESRGLEEAVLYFRNENRTNVVLARAVVDLLKMVSTSIC